MNVELTEPLELSVELLAAEDEAAAFDIADDGGGRIEFIFMKSPNLTAYSNTPLYMCISSPAVIPEPIVSGAEST